MNRKRNIFKNTYKQLVAMTLVIVISYSTVSYVLIKKHENFVIESYKNNIKENVELLLKAINHDIKHYKNIHKSDFEIMNYLKDIVRSMIYKNNEVNYYFIISYDGTQIVNPLYPDLEGKNNLLENNNFSQKKLNNLIIKAEKEGGIFFEYEYYSQNKEEIETKISYLVPIPEYKIFIGTGIYLNEIKEQVNDYASKTIALTVLIIFITFFTLYLISEPILRVNGMMFKAFFEMTNKPDKIKPINLNNLKYSSDSYKIAVGFNNMITSIEDNNRLRKMLIKTIPDIILLLDDNYKILKINDNNFDSSYNPKLNDEMITKIKNYDLSKGNNFILTLEDDSNYEVRINSFLFENNNYYVVVLTDITERLKTEQALSKSEKKYKQIFENTKDALFVVDEYGNFIFYNKSSKNIFGETLSLELNLFDFFANDQDKNTIKNLLDEDCKVFYYQTEIKNTNNTIIPTELTLYNYDDIDNNSKKFQGVIRDLSERKKLEKKLLQSQKLEAIGQLAGGIAHDFNNLLTVILGNSDLLLMSLPPENSIKDELLEIKQSAERASKLTTQLLAFSKNQIINPEVIDINEVINNIFKILQRLIGENINLTLNLQNDIQPIKADKSQIEQIIINLCVNARDALNELNPDNKTINISTYNLPQSELNEIVLSVRDNGPGIPDNLLQKIYDPFFSTKPANKGTGLGLSTIFGIVNQNLATISIETSTSKPSYTEFVISWPSTKENFNPIKSNTDTIPENNMYEILLVEDELSLRKFAVNALSMCGHTIHDTGSILEAEKILNNNKNIDAYFIDIVLPDGNGIEFAKKIKETNPEAKIIFTSGYPDHSPEELNSQKDNYFFLRKPYSIKELREIIQKIK